MSKKLYSKAAFLTKFDGRNTVTKLAMGYCTAESPAEAKGEYLEYLLKEFPTFAVGEMLVMEIPETIFSCDVCNPIGDKKE
jgi:hypothetical protein